MLAAYALCVLAPVLYPMLVAIHRRPVLPRRAVFVIVVAALCHGAMGLIDAVIVVPISAVLVYVTPQFEATGVYAG